MVFSSIPAYLDPSNWQQQSNNQNIVSSQVGASQLLPPPPSELHGGGGGGGGSSGSIRPGSMSERARMANIQMPEGPLKCPRCESTNTKFCYFNNYSLSQPRHFCKTCRRYWTRGGALRNVPVGGGYRRNKRSKGSSSKTSSISQTSTGSSTSSMPSICSTADILGLTHPQVMPLRFMTPLNPLNEFGESDIGFNYSGIPIPANLGAPNDFNFQQLSLLSGLDPSSASYPTCGIMTHQLGSVKMEETHPGLNMPRNFMGFSGNDHQYWSGAGSSGAWTDLSGFSSSSASHPL